MRLLQGEQTAETDGAAGIPIEGGGGDVPSGQAPPPRRNYRTRTYRSERPAGQNENEADPAVSVLDSWITKVFTKG